VAYVNTAEESFFAELALTAKLASRTLHGWFKKLPEYSRGVVILIPSLVILIPQSREKNPFIPPQGKLREGSAFRQIKNLADSSSSR